MERFAADVMRQLKRLSDAEIAVPGEALSIDQAAAASGARSLST
jgi:hypothetical protein